MNNSLGYVDPERLQEGTAWEQLTAAERRILAPKLVRVANGGETTTAEPETACDVFNKNFGGANDRDSAVLVTGVKNFIDNAGGHSNTEVWQLISSLMGGWSGKNDSAGIAFHVKNAADFLDVLRQSGQYDVDAGYERLNLTSDHIHSARFITETSYQPGMHLSQEKGYPDTRFDVHWDPRSAAFRNLSDYILVPLAAVRKNLERARAGLSHNNPKSSAQTRQELRRMGIVP
ncbi:MAG TPA: hypothetical protein VGV87_13995 [Blastocatellia bacterium]|jgi:hypothetical protein|nr:hypothetical protein [Blastocatellia bacterium]